MTHVYSPASGDSQALSLRLAFSVYYVLLILLLSCFIAPPALADGPPFTRQRTLVANTAAVATGDLNGDGALDIIATYGDQDIIYLNDGAGNFNGNPVDCAVPPADVHCFGPDNTTMTDVAVGDIDGDGALDILTSNYDFSSGNPAPSLIYLNNGAGNFYAGPLDCASPPAGVRCFGSVESSTGSLALGDLDGDGALDIISELGVFYLNDGTGHFYTGPVDCASQPPNARCFGQGNGSILSVALGDMDRDGSLDIVAGGFQASFVYLNDSAGNFYTGPVDCAASSAGVRCFGPPGYPITSLALGDVNGDSTLDIVAGNVGIPNSMPSTVYLNGGAANFYAGSINCSGPPANVRCIGPGAYYANQIALVDIDSDNDLDIALGNSDLLLIGDFLDSNPDTLYLNDGFGNFSTGPIFGATDVQTTGIMAGDLDGDGGLDIISSGNFDGVSLTTLFINDTGADFATFRVFGQPDPAGPNFSGATSLAVGDMNGDSHLDVVVGQHEQDLVYLNDGAGYFPVQHPFGPAHSMEKQTRSVAVGDMDGDDDLDIVVGGTPNLFNSTGGQDRIYLNDGGGTFFAGLVDCVNPPAAVRCFGPNNVNTTSVVVGDMNGDGHLDLVTGNDGQPNVIYLNDGGGNFYVGPVDCVAPPAGARCFGPATGATLNLALGDMDGDGDLDIIAATSQQDGVYLNDGGGNFYAGAVNCTPGSIPWRCFGPGDTTITRVAVGDMDGDGDLDIIAGNRGQDAVYLNDGAAKFPIFTPLVCAAKPGMRCFGPATDQTSRVTVADFDGDGDLDIISANDQFLKSELHLNDGRSNFSPGRPIKATDYTDDIAAGDMDGDGDYDIAVAYNGGTTIYSPSFVLLNEQTGPARLANNPPQLTVVRPGPTRNAAFFSTPIIQGSQTIPISYTLADPEGDPVGRVVAFYSLNGGGQWFPARPTTDTVTTNLATTATGVEYRYTWDTFASNILGQSDNVVLRLVAYPAGSGTNAPATYQYPDIAAGPYQRAYAASVTFPFRVRGAQVQVISGTTGVADALVYRLPAGQAQGGLPLGNAGQPFRTDSQGYLQGRGQIALGDRLLALAPVSLPPIYTTRYSDSLHLYYTNGVPMPDIAGLNTPTITEPGVQQLLASADNPLLLFDLDVSLEWDASSDPVYLQQLQFDLQRASEHLYDFTNGRVALGKITIYQNKEQWDIAHIRVLATNRLRPFAVQGGIVLTETIDPDHSTEPDKIVYDIGQVVMGATWNRYGNAGQNLGQDWPLTLAHELSHYLLFLDDTYLGLNSDGLLIAVDTQQPASGCTGSAMGDVYTPDNSEFIFDETFWQQRCGQTLPAQTLQRNEWATISLWYPWLQPPAVANPGPSLMPFDLTEVTMAPFTPTNTLADPTFVLDYANSAVSSSEGQGFLFRNEDNNPADYETIINLGSPAGGQNRLLARGARPGDRLCAFDPPRRQFGCEVIALGDERLSLRSDDTWTPFIQLSPVNTTTFSLLVSNLPGGLALKARLYPDDSLPAAVIDLVETNGNYEGQFPSFAADKVPRAGNIQVWVEPDVDPRREAVVAFSIGGNPPKTRGGGPKTRGGGPKTRGGGAPLVSPDGQFIFFTPNPNDFGENEFYTIQAMSGLPALPPGKKAMGPSYNLLAFPGNLDVPGSVSFQYLGLDALLEQVDENKLTIHFWDGQKWMALPTTRDAYYNLASALSQGPGVYALLAGVAEPVIASVSPAAATNELTQTLTISGGYFLPPLEVALVRPTVTYTLPLGIVTPYSLTAIVTQALSAAEYQVRVVNGDGGVSPAPGTFALYDPAEACFYDFFESGAGKWSRSGDWAITSLPTGEQVMTDSPAGPYKSAADYTPNALSYTTTMTSQPFSLAACALPVLAFDHAYSIVPNDAGRVEISTDEGATWQTLATYANNSSASIAAQSQSQEWANVALQPVQISLNAYTGTVRLRFSLEVDQDVAAKGWVLDNLMVKSGENTTTPNRNIFLPVVIKEK